MFKCLECGNIFDSPEIKRPDAGHTVMPYEILLHEISPLRLCPACMSSRIEKEVSKRKLQTATNP